MTNAHIYRWLFSIEDENGDTHYLAEEEFVGTSTEADKAAKALADRWELDTGGLVLRLELERRGLWTARNEFVVEATNDQTTLAPSATEATAGGFALHPNLQPD
jgi:hypothetical protein